LFLALLSLILLRGFSPNTSAENNPYGPRVVIWGPFPFNDVEDVLQQITDEEEAFGVVDYVFVSKEQFADRFLNAIAEGNAPDLVMLPHTELVSQRSKLLPIPYDTDGFSTRNIRDRYVDGAEIFALQNGLYAVPYVVDPLVLYWNRDLFAGAGLSGPPRSWEQLVGEAVGALTVRDNSRTILQSALAFGEFRNVRNATAVLSLLMMQSGSTLVTETDRGYEVALNESLVGGRPPLEAALQFYTDFANASNPLYSWNRAQAEDRQAFIAGDVAMYFGFASEAAMIQDRNPNLNFDVAPVPQGSSATVARTYGNFYGLAIPRASRNPQGAFVAARTLASAQNSLNMAVAVGYTPVHRAALTAGTSDAYAAVGYEAALVARGWLQPDSASTDTAFQSMVEDVNSARSRVGSAASDAINRLIMAY